MSIVRFYWTCSSISGVYTFFAAARNEIGIVPVKLTVKEYKITGQSIPDEIKAYLEANGDSAEYASVYDGKVLVLEEIKKEASSSALSDSQNNLRVDKYPSASEISIEDLMGLVNSEYRKYLPKETDRYSLDRDGDSSSPKRTVLAGSSIGSIVSRVRSNTYAYSKFFNETELAMQGLREEDMAYKTIRGSKQPKVEDSLLSIDYLTLTKRRSSTVPADAL